MGKIINLYFFYTCNNIISTFLNLEFFLSHIRFFLSANEELQQLTTKNCSLKILRMSPLQIPFWQEEETAGVEVTEGTTFRFPPSGALRMKQEGVPS